MSHISLSCLFGGHKSLDSRPTQLIQDDLILRALIQSQLQRPPSPIRSHARISQIKIWRSGFEGHSSTHYGSHAQAWSQDTSQALIHHDSMIFVAWAHLLLGGHLTIGHLCCLCCRGLLPILCPAQGSFLSLPVLTTLPGCALYPAPVSHDCDQTRAKESPRVTSNI